MKPVLYIGAIIILLFGVGNAGQSATTSQQRQELRLPGSREMPASIKILVETDKLYVGEKFHVRVEVRDGMNACTGVGINSIKLKYEDAEIECVDHEPHKTSPGKYEQCIRGLLPGDLKIIAIVNDGQKEEKVVHMANAIDPKSFRFRVDKMDNGSGIVRIKNMEIIPDEKKHYGREVQKMTCHIWEHTSMLDLSQFLEGYKPDDENYHAQWMATVNQLKWLIWCPDCPKWVYNLNNPNFKLPGLMPERTKALHMEVVLRYQEPGKTAVDLDRLLIAVVPLSTKNSFNRWFIEEAGKEGPERNSKLQWTKFLPKSIPWIEYNRSAEKWAYPDESLDQLVLWEKPPTDHSNSVSYYHPGMKYEMRSEELWLSGKIGNQSCYAGMDPMTSKAELISKGIGAGSADKRRPDVLEMGLQILGELPKSHISEDVWPFIWAAQLDGNPVNPSNVLFTNLNKPILFSGKYLEKYLTARPIVK